MCFIIQEDHLVPRKLRMADMYLYENESQKEEMGEQKVHDTVLALTR